MSSPPSTLEAEIAELRRQLAQREAELQIINSVQVGLAEHRDVQAIYDLVGDKIRDIFHAQVVMISTYDKRAQTIEHRYAIERGARIYAPGQHPIRGFRIWVVETRQPVLVSANVAELAAQLGQPTLPGTITPKTWLGVPMIVGEDVTGILSLQDVDREQAFDEPVVRLLQTLAASMSVALENARLWEQEVRYHKAAEREFEIGRAIQASFLPGEIPQPDGWEIAAVLVPAREVAGDFYDVFALPENRFGLVIGDVCDKGLGAALFMTLYRSLLRSAANPGRYVRSGEGDGLSPAGRLKSAIALTNNYIAETHGRTGMFATVFCAILDARSGDLTYANCGHPSPLLYSRDGSPRALDRTGPGLGVIPDAEHAIREEHLGPGEVLFAFTDGLTDTDSPSAAAFQIADAGPHFARPQPLSSLLDQLLSRVEIHAGGAPQYDDITLLGLRRSLAAG